MSRKPQHYQQQQPEMEFKPLVQVDPSLLSSNRMPLKNPRPGDYLLNKTPSTEGIASKKSLELKKRYLLGEQNIGNGIMKSGSTSKIDSKLRDFHSNISECQKLLNPSADISPTMKTFLNRTKVGEADTKTIFQLGEKSSDEKENVCTNNQNELNKEIEYSETINTALIETKSKELAQIKQQQSSQIIQTIDLISPEKVVPIIDLTNIDLPSEMIKTNQKFVDSMKIDEILEGEESVIDLTGNSPEKCDNKRLDKEVEIVIITKDEKPDVSKDVKEKIPDIITQIEQVLIEKNSTPASGNEFHNSSSCDTLVKADTGTDTSGSLFKENDVFETSIKVPNIPWNNKKQNEENDKSDSLSNSSSDSSLDDIPHYILDSTTSPDTQNGMEQIVPRLEVHDTSGALMQIDSLMIVDGKYVGDPEDLKHMEIPEGTKIDLPEEKNLEADVETAEVSPSRSPMSTPTPTPSPIPPQENLITPSDRPDLKFDTKNENKIEMLKNLPLILDKEESEKHVKPTYLDLGNVDISTDYSADKDRTPTAERVMSDSETEMTGQVLTETELSDWTADDVVSENFVDIEFALNSNKGTIKRNKKSKKKSLMSKAPVLKKTPEFAKDCGILKNLDIDEIEFMDTGSEGSCAEAYSATNKVMLQNRGYIQFIDNNHEAGRQSSPYARYEHEILPPKIELYKPVFDAVNKEVAGIDYIEQGACILNNDIEAKTPVNETPQIFSQKFSGLHQMSQFQTTPLQSQPLSQSQPPDSLNDMDDDSLVQINSQSTGNTTTATTTEESDALTIVTSPMDGLPKSKETPSSSERNERTASESITPKTPVQKKAPPDETRKRQSIENLLNSSGSSRRKDSEELSYEEYVRKLQMKITQISNARDSIDIRKQKRKSSKGEVGEGAQNNSVIDIKNFTVFDPLKTPTADPSETAVSIQQQTIPKLTEIPTVSRKIEELTKERMKQKDLIHDLVMDKLQSKKQLNAEKRLNRSRNRSLFSPGGIPPIPKLDSNNCSNSPHYHVASSSERRSSKPPCTINLSTAVNTSVSPAAIAIAGTTSASASTLRKEQMSYSVPPSSMTIKTKCSPIESKTTTQIFASPPRSKERPLSDNLENINFSAHTSMPKITKTKSFCVYTAKDLALTEEPAMSSPTYSMLKTEFDAVNGFSTPVPPPRSSKKLDEISLAKTEKLRAEARARARLMSNTDLGLSPEEKLQMLRKRYHLDLKDATLSASGGNVTAANKSDDMKVRERKIITSKSVNDITTVQNLHSDENLSSKSPLKLSDFTSDPNLTESQQLDREHQQKSRRRKDPERRKSIIQAVSSFFQKKKDKETPSPPKEKGADGMFSRFRISPKSKEKSKDKDDIISGGEHTKSQDCLKGEMSSCSSSPQLFQNQEEVIPPPIPPLPANYQRSDDESYATESREYKKQRAISKASRQAELKRLRIAQENQREQEEIEVKLKELEARGVVIEKAIRGEGQNIENLETSSMGASDQKLFNELFEIWRNTTQLQKRDEELAIRQKELQLEHRHAQLKEELNMRLSCSKLDKSLADVRAEGAILNEMLEIVAKRAALRPDETAMIRSPSTDNDAEI